MELALPVKVSMLEYTTENSAWAIGYSDASNSASLALEDALRHHINMNLHTQLCPEGLALTFQISRSLRYRFFKSEGGVRKFNQERRLLRCLKMLTRTMHAHMSIASVALNSGFKSNAHFSRLFKAKFDMTAGQTRSAAFEHRAGNTGGDRLLRDWFDQL